MNRAIIQKQLASLSLSMFRKDFFGIYHGSLSAKMESNKFFINTREAVFDNIDESSLIELYFKKDYRWHQASIDAAIHRNIYTSLSDAKYVCFAMPPFTTAYSIDHNIISPRDYFGYTEIGSLEIFDPKQYDDWYDRAESLIAHHFLTTKTDIMVIRGYGVYAFNRDLHEMAKKMSILEKSCRLLMIDVSKNDYDFM